MTHELKQTKVYSQLEKAKQVLIEPKRGDPQALEKLLDKHYAVIVVVHLRNGN